MSVSSNSILIVAAEASSSLYAQRLLENWRSQKLKVSPFGVGSEAMEKLGFERLGKSEEMAVVGIQEVIKHYSDIKKVYHKLLDAAKKREPKVALLLDYPEFNLRLAKDLKALGIPVVYYISPQVWAWRTGRIHQIKRDIDEMLVLFPFERDFYQKHGVKVEFVGHPALDEIDAEWLTENYQKTQREKFGIKTGELVLGLMPGSRRSELDHCFEAQLATAELLRRQIPNLRVMILVAPTLGRDEIRRRIGRHGSAVQIVQKNPMEMIALTDAVLVASGTATMMVGLMEKPMVIMYRMNPITAFLAKLLVRSTPFFGMVNLIMGRKIVPELFQNDASPEKLAEELRPLLLEEQARESQVEDLKKLRHRLGSLGATSRVSEHLRKYIPEALI